MKNATTILTHITHLPQFNSIGKHRCYYKFTQSLPLKFQKAIAFLYIKNSTLYIALSHPGYKMELNYNKDLLKTLLSMRAEHDRECRDLQANEIVIFNSKYHTKEEQKSYESNPRYYELAQGDFELNIQDVEIRNKFETIKAIIDQFKKQSQ